MSKGSEAVKKWRRNAKQRLIRAFGGGCAICNYNKCDEVLEFHHLDPSTKETTWGAMRGNIKGWNTILLELQKCVMLCSNCHKEVHAGIVSVPDNATRLDTTLTDYRIIEKQQFYDACKVCGTEKLKRSKTCSYKCARKMQGKVDWSQYDLFVLLQQHKTYEAVGDLLGVSGAAVSRKLKQIQTGKW